MPTETTINALSQAGIGIAALIALMAQIALIILMVREMSRVGFLLVQAIQQQTSSNDHQTISIEALRADLNKNTSALTGIEGNLSRLPMAVRTELAPSIAQLLEAIETVIQYHENPSDNHRDVVRN